MNVLNFTLTDNAKKKYMSLVTYTSYNGITICWIKMSASLRTGSHWGTKTFLRYVNFIRAPGGFENSRPIFDSGVQSIIRIINFLDEIDYARTII